MININNDFPLVIDFSTITIADFITWFKSNKEDIDKKLLEKGAVLFRGIDIDSLDKFEAIVDSIPNKFLNYVDGNSPRTKLSSKVYTSTEYDSNYSITLHNELSYSNSWPNQLFFCCIIPALSGGETPIADSRKILKAMEMKIVEDIKTKGIKYIRNLHGGNGFGPSWQDTFETKEKVVVENFCKDNSSEYIWDNDNGLRIIQRSAGIISHPVTQEEVWFNQIDQFHPSHLNPEIYETLMFLYKNNESALPMNVTFGDDSPISSDMVKSIRNTIDQLAISSPWQKGDLLFVDNVLVCHGRNPYKGDRKVLVSML